MQVRGYGKKCVRLGMGEVVAAWTKPEMSHDKKGEMAFLYPDRGALGGGFEVLCVISVAIMMEKDRRAKQRQRQNRRGANSIF